ncbi:MAG: methionyl-tRNA formyltransferase [Proteobacteria bacterium]|nr:methionyl-tRNA formyltransferase [Pseudomonadota bacterium]
MRLAYFGTPPFAVPALERLLAGPHPVVAVVSQPDRARGRGRKTSPSPVSEVALRAGVPLLRPERVGADDCVEALRAEAPDLGVVAAFGQFLPKTVRELPRLGYCINAHASLLPRHRGAAPIARAILAGEERTGISIMRVEREMDAGPVAFARECSIEPEDDTGSLTDKLAVLAADAVAEAVASIAEDALEFSPQDASQATLAPKLEREEARLDFREPAEELARRIRALAPKPGAHTSLQGDPLRILATAVDPRQADAPPGTVRGTPPAPLRIATGGGWLVPRVVQRAGGKPLAIEDFLRGRAVPDGTRLGDDGASERSAP